MYGLFNGKSNIIRTSDTKKLKSKDPADLQVKEVALDIVNNTKAHYTDEFDITNPSDRASRKLLIVRRGQAFKINVTFNRAFDKNQDDLRLTFQFGKQPKPSSGTFKDIILSEMDDRNDWGAWLESSTDNVASFQIMTPPTIPVGKWKMGIDVIKRKERSSVTFRYEHKDHIYILFNPWCKDDSVYMEDEDGSLLGEYVLNDTGKIYVGSSKSIHSTPWVFGQFTGDVLDTALYLLDCSWLRDENRGNAILVARKLSALVNSNDDNGVLVGRWQEPYTGGTRPTTWVGSVAILNEFFRKKKPVKYGQCWVFSGVLTTVCRAIGIPARSVTNFDSAHDTNGSMTIDHYVDSKGEIVNFDDRPDSRWNFHVWNDVWMARPDLEPGYGGWQAIDATPQEMSNGYAQMGPMSLRAIREGKVVMNYDGPFVFAEVNADEVYWKLDGKRGTKVIKVNTDSIGKCISTKRVPGTKTLIPEDQDEDREDVTHLYKFKEGTPEERAAVKEAITHSKTKNICDMETKDVNFAVMGMTDLYVGQAINMQLLMENRSSDNRTIHGTVVIGTTYYTGVFHKELLKKKFRNTIVRPQQQEKCEFEVDDYYEHLLDHGLCTMSVVCYVKETEQHFIERKTVRLKYPDINFTCGIDEMNAVQLLGKKTHAEVYFENPLPIALTKCELRVEGPVLLKPVICKQPNVVPKGKFKTTITVVPTKIGKRDIVVSFNCQQLPGWKATKTITVT
ncbi:hemocyte protein-glutamine gamma-glutamyltransferase-like isoform X1 [Mya arenaria]|uniref:hemocyte protein-glutamine gamma-glutamyltransferase-like isoform X1 n=1 Tax=Mya arenaria TaxID=6604 RepID=UPI0022E8C2D3|nr:hemocyte protein-glutamine gamma-glutamyltransferase-like isoform X1 [Mya arenaria]XP_052815833.1 hemocyte protein-glutamine gamma-glutamyltransferase-like isoform X1 [Mya arenaria]